MQKIETGFSELLHKQPETETQKDAYIHELQNAVQVLLDEVRNLDEMVALLRKKQFGSSSEKTPVPEEEPLGMFTEAEAEYQPDAPEPYKKDKRGVHRKNQEDKWKLEKPENTENRVHDLDPEKQICPQCGGRLNWMGKELVRETFEYIPAQMKLVRHWQTAYQCPHCRKNGRTVIVRAAVEKPLLNHSMVSASVVSEVMYQKYANAMPLYRQEEMWRQLGVTFSRTCMAKWVIRCAEDWLEPLWDAMHAELLKRQVLHADETVVQVLREKGKAPQSKSYMWVYRTGRDGKPPIILYEYQPGRSGEYPKKFLKGFHGYLHTDGYAGYNQLEGMTRCGCWAHLRRKFVEALPPVTSNPLGMPTPAQIGRNYCDQLFAVEKKLADLPAKERQKQRLAVEKPMLRAFWCWLDELAQQPLAGGLKKAVQYAQKQRPYMENYLLDGRCELSNNLAENAIRPFTVGRKNWLFCDTVRGAKASAVIYSLIETAQANDLSPKAYLHICLANLPSMDFRQHPEELLSLMPWSAYMQSCFKQDE